MTYQVLARKWRPRDFSSLVGQDHVVTALRNGLKEGRIAQAYLFSGIRGVGKTTAARVLAKALNCHEGPSADPCNECPSCLDINAGKSLEVIEIDAATYSKVEQVRELTESLRYGPADSRYKKVVVLDEVHRLSRQAFDALLKIVEEPPEHLVFIFATTEIDAVPATILSRCQEFQFRRVPSGVLSAHLRTIAEAEDITVSDTALRLVARAGEGSVRDSVALLDQMATFGNGAILDEDAARLLGGLDAAIFQRLLGAILEGEHGSISEIVHDVEINGWDPSNVYAQFLSFTRDGLHLAMGGATQAVELPAEEAETLRELVRPHGYEALLQILQLLLTSESMVRHSELGGLALEVTWLRAAELPKVARIQDLLSGKTPLPESGASGPTGGHSNSGGPTTGGSRTAASRSAKPREDGPQTGESAAETKPDRSAPDPIRDLEAVGHEERDHPAADSRGDAGAESRGERNSDQAPERVGLASLAAEQPGSAEPEKSTESASPIDPSRIPFVLEMLGSRRQSLAALFSSAALAIRGAELLIAPRADDTFLPSALRRDRNKSIFEQVLASVWGRTVPWRLVALTELGDDHPGAISISPRSEAEPWPSASQSASPSAANDRSTRPAAAADETAGPNRASSRPQPSSHRDPSSRHGYPEDPPADPARHEPATFWPRAQPDGAWEAGGSADGSDSRPSHSFADDRASEAQWREAADLPTVKAVIDLFGGHIQQVREIRQESP